MSATVEQLPVKRNKNSFYAQRKPLAICIHCSILISMNRVVKRNPMGAK